MGAALPINLADLARRLEANHAELRGLIAALAADVARIASHPPGRPLNSADEAAIAALLPLLYERWPARVFVTAEIAALAKLDPRIKRALGIYATSPKRLGRLLVRATGATLCGYEVGVVGEASPRTFAVRVSNPLETAET